MTTADNNPTPESPWINSETTQHPNGQAVTLTWDIAAFTAEIDRIRELLRERGQQLATALGLAAKIRHDDMIRAVEELRRERDENAPTEIGETGGGPPAPGWLLAERDGLTAQVKRLRQERDHLHADMNRLADNLADQAECYNSCHQRVHILAGELRALTQQATQPAESHAEPPEPANLHQATNPNDHGPTATTTG